MTDYKKGEGYGTVSVGKCSPCQILYHAIIFVLSGRVTCVKKCNFLTQPVCLKEVMETADDIVGSFATLSSLVGAQRIAVLFWWHIQQRSVIGFKIMTDGRSDLQRRLKVVCATVCMPSFSLAAVQ